VGDAELNSTSEEASRQTQGYPTLSLPLPLTLTLTLTRWEMHGVLGNSVRNQCVLLGYMWGVPIPRIAEWYYGTHGKKKY